MSNQKIEILAPAGSIEGMRAAFAAGADAVYIGGQSFGARAFAQNADRGALLEAIDEAHLHDRKLYLTVNTLLKNDELFEHLSDYLTPFYAQGLDAVLVQDLGVLRFIRSAFPDLPVHASTQMTVCGPKYGLWLKDAGVSRLVLPRELSLNEIHEMKVQTGLDIEVFVHGALCYSYSGQCLMSSMIGGRSGNRGRCAQPCRLQYGFRDGVSRKNGHLLSLKDLCGLESLPDLIAAGVDSLKIEGRMKKPEYAALTSRIYRHYTDIILEKGPQNYHVSDDDMRDLMDLYSRGGFTNGYYYMHNNAAMLTPDRPNHSGTIAGEIVSGRGGMHIRLCEDVHAGDVLELPDGREFTVKSEQTAGDTLMLRKGTYRSGQKVLRTKNALLVNDISERYVRKPVLKEKVSGVITLRKDTEAVLELYGGRHHIAVTGAKAAKAEGRPLTEETVRRQMEKTGSTPYEYEELKVEMEDDVFLPVSELNALRRKAFEAFEAMVSGSFRRTVSPDQSGTITREPVSDRMDEKDRFVPVNALVSTMPQLRICLNYPEVKRIYLELSCDISFLREAESQIHHKGKEMWLAMPHIWRNKTEKSLDRDDDMIRGLHADGFLVRNMESLFWLKDHQYDQPCISDAGIYMMNDLACDTGRSLFSQITMPFELNRHELTGMRDIEVSEIIAYGEIPLMISAQCILKTCGACKKTPGRHILTDRMNKEIPVKNVCKWCYNVIDNPQPLFVPELRSGDLGGRRPASVRLQFTDEDMDLAGRVLDRFVHGGPYKPAEYTRGHYKRGVE